MRVKFRWLKIAVSFLLPWLAPLLFVTSCTRQKAELAPTDLAVSNITLGKPAFQFDPAQAISLNIAKADPISGETWSARVEKSPSTRFWQITSYSGGSHLSDRLANRAWILHFLETLTTFRPDAILPDADLGKFGFFPPRYSLEWRTQTYSYELKVGAPVDFESKPDGEAFTMFPTHGEIYEAGGAALVMLRYLKTFSSLRLETLSTIESADVTAIEISGKKTLRSRFDGKKWQGRDVSPIVDLITHLRIQSFLDSDMNKPHAFSPQLTILLTDRYSHVTELSIDENDLAKNSDRQNALFQLYPGGGAKLISLVTSLTRK